MTVIESLDFLSPFAHTYPPAAFAVSDEFCQYYWSDWNSSLISNGGDSNSQNNTFASEIWTQHELYWYGVLQLFTKNFTVSYENVVLLKPIFKLITK